MTIIKLDHIAKIEGHANLTLHIERGKLKDLSFETTEGARFFEGIVVGRKYYDVQKFVSRICGVCSQAHLLGAILAIEDAMGIKVSDQTRKLRDLVNIAAIIQSHTLHDFFLALPDYLGYDSAITMLPKYGAEIKGALKIKKIANDINAVIGGRDVHCITLVVGGFSKTPLNSDLKALHLRVREGKAEAIKAAKLFASLDYPDFERKTEYVALSGDGYALNRGKIVSTEGLDIPAHRYGDYIKEVLRDYAASKFALLNGHGYFVGALARININHDHLCDDARSIMDEMRYKFPSYNPFLNNLAQAIELVHLFDQAEKILSGLEIERECEPDMADFKVRGGHGFCALEVPRGTLLHEYIIDDKGIIEKCNIIAPTTQNLKNIEDDLKEFVPGLLARKVSKKAMILEVEKLIRAYDPCISCSTHFLKVDIRGEKW